MVEFYLILAAINKANSGMFWRLLIGSLVMLIGGYLGEAGYINATLGFVGSLNGPMRLIPTISRPNLTFGIRILAWIPFTARSIPTLFFLY